MVTWICDQNKPWAQHHHSLKLETEVSQLGILFSTVVRAAVVGKLVILGISPLTSFILALKKALVAKLVISDILSSMFLILALHIPFFKTSFFTSSISLLKSTGTGTNLLTL